MFINAHPSERTMKFLLVVLFVIWSNAFTAIKHLREIFSPMELVLLRFLPVSIYCLLFILLSKKTREETKTVIKESPLRIVIMSLCGVAGYNLFLYIGQSEIKPGAAALLTTLSPLFTLILAILIIKEKVPIRRAVGIIMAFAGIYSVIRWGKVGLGRMINISNAELRYSIITALAPLSWSFYTIMAKTVLKRRSPITVTYLTILLGTIPFYFFLNQSFLDKIPQMELSHWIALIHLSLLCTIVGFWIWFAGLSVLPATTVSSFIYLNPPFAIFFSYIFFGEEVTGYFILGSAIVLAGLYLAQSSKNNS